MKEIILSKIEKVEKSKMFAVEMRSRIIIGERNSCKPFMIARQLKELDRIINFNEGYITALRMILNKLDRRNEDEKDDFIGN